MQGQEEEVQRRQTRLSRRLARSATDILDRNVVKLSPLDCFLYALEVPLTASAKHVILDKRGTTRN